MKPESELTEEKTASGIVSAIFIFSALIGLGVGFLDHARGALSAIGAGLIAFVVSVFVIRICFVRWPGDDE